MHPLLAEPTDEQTRLLDVIYQGRELAGWPNFRGADTGGVQRVGGLGRWPIFQYVEAILYQEHKLDARTTLAECPLIAGEGGSYGWTWSARAGAPLTIGPRDELALTVAGMARVPRASKEVAVFLDALTIMIERERSFAPSPTEVQTVELSLNELSSNLSPPRGRWRRPDPVELVTIFNMLSREPATWHCRVLQSEKWVVELSPFLRGYEGLTAPDEYLERVVDVIAPLLPVPEPLYPSALSLPEAIDYLNAVWRRHAKRPLLKVARAEAAAKLALDCATADEFDSRLSALCTILDALELPDGDAHRLVNLGAYLERELSEGSRGRALAAVGDLRALFDLRAWRQHSGTERRAAAGMQRLGVSLPVTDWEAAWRHLQARGVAALAALREEVETLDPL